MAQWDCAPDDVPPAGGNEAGSRLTAGDVSAVEPAEVTPEAPAEPAEPEDPELNE
jgi:hypothetical protein